MDYYTETTTASAIRRFVLALFLLGLLGSGAELLLLGHTEDVLQWVPLILTVLSLAVLVWRAVDRGRSSVRTFQGTMLLFILSGMTGILLHYKGNVEFELEMYPSLGGLDLVWNSITGATPFLAPGAMIVLGYLGLVYTYRHPDLRRSRRLKSENTGGSQ